MYITLIHLFVHRNRCWHSYTEDALLVSSFDIDAKTFQGKLNLWKKFKVLYCRTPRESKAYIKHTDKETAIL